MAEMKEISVMNFWEDFGKYQPYSTVDELECDNCGDWIGYSSDGECREFWINEENKLMLCAICYEDRNDA